MNDKQKGSYNEQLHDRGELPKVKIVRGARKEAEFAGAKVIIPPLEDFDELMRAIPYGELISSEHIRRYLALKYNADYTCSVTSRKFIILVAYASAERHSDETSYWRTLKKDGELNAKYPHGIEGQRRLLEGEGHVVVQRGQRYYVSDYQDKIHALSFPRM
nr:methylated DNA-protein cysteine methyltransferase [Bacilli bacterium]